MSYAFAITCLECRQAMPLLSIDPVENGDAEPWIRLVMGCGHTPSVPGRHRAAIERIAFGTSGGYGLFDPDQRPTYIVRGHPTGSKGTG